MNRTDRLYGLVEELRAVAPRPRSAAWLARRFEVSVRTVERDLAALRDSGVPLWTVAGRTGGYAIDRDFTLPPLALTPAEALAVRVALRGLAGSPFAGAARSALVKVLAVVPPQVRRDEQHLAARIHEVGAVDPADSWADRLATAVQQRRGVRLRYEDRAGAVTEREVEPLGLLRGPEHWYLLAWCRLRRANRGFRFDRIHAAELLAPLGPARQSDVDSLAYELARLDARALPDAGM